MIIKNTVGFNFISEVNQSMGYGILLVVNDLSQVSEQDIQDAQDSSSGSGGFGAGGCCAAGSKATKFANGNIPINEIAVAEIKEGKQYVTINVNDYGFSPAVVVMQKGIDTVWNINGEQLNSCNNRLTFPEYYANISLRQGANELILNPESDFSFGCWMGMLHGYVRVVDDINNYNMDEVKEKVKNFKPSKTSGAGCCG
jgi:hypothetical protein